MYHITGPNTSYTVSSAQITLLMLVVIWELVWKGFALWRAGRNNQAAWFIVLLFVNTLGILEIIYLLAFQRKTKDVPTSR